MNPTYSYFFYLSQARLTALLKKRLLGKPYLLTGDVLTEMALFYDLAAVLAVVHREQLATFAHAFLSLTGEAEDLERAFRAEAENDRRRTDEETTMMEAAMAGEAERISFPEPPENMLFRFGQVKIDGDVGIAIVRDAAFRGLALGIQDPELIRRRFELSNRPTDRETIESARAAGLELDENVEMTWEDAVEEFDGGFREFCQESKPEAFAVLFA